MQTRPYRNTRVGEKPTGKDEISLIEQGLWGTELEVEGNSEPIWGVKVPVKINYPTRQRAKKCHKAAWPFMHPSGLSDKARPQQRPDGSKGVSRGYVWEAR